MRFETEYAKLNTRQKQAVDEIDGPVMVIAGPGTGKTQLLSMRVANILKNSDVLASNILCLTFTESGQLAMERRLLNFIGTDAYKVSIYTFHGFGTAVISSNPDYFYDSAQFKAASDLSIFEMLHDIFEAMPHGSLLGKKNNGEYIYLNDARSRISQLKQAGITPDHLRQLIQDDGEWCAEAERIIQNTYSKFKRFDATKLPLFDRLVDDLEDLHVSEKNISWIQPLSETCIRELKEAVKAANDIRKSAPITSWKTIWLQPNGGSQILKARKQHLKLNELANIYEAYLEALHKQQLYDYDDMILDVTKVLEEQPDLLATLQEQYQYILVDEFQDTNGAQARLLEMLANNPIHEGRPNIMVVGDDDQAIYGFQGADSGIMMRFREQYRDVSVIILDENYRSTQQILDTARSLIIQGTNRLENYYPDISKALTAKTELSNFQPESNCFKTEYEQYWWLVEKIQKLIKAGMPAHEIAVIAPKHKHLQKLMPYMIDAEIPVHYERKADVLQEPHIVQLLTLAKVIQYTAAGRHDEANDLMPELLSFDFWEIPAHQIWQLSLAHSRIQESESYWLERLCASDVQILKNIGDWLVEMSKLSATEPLERMLDRLIGDEIMIDVFGSPYRRYIFASERLEHERVEYMQLLSGLIAIRRSLREYQPGESLFLKDFVRYTELCSRANVSILDKHPLFLGDDAVQVMTAHKAKGLEFQTVFIINADEKVWVKDKGKVNNISLPPNLTIQPAGENADDKLRLFYVAVTRAKQRLFFSRFVRDNEDRERIELNWLADESTALMLKNNHLQDDARLKQNKLLASIVYDWRSIHTKAILQPEMRTLLQPRLDYYRLSPTHLNAFLDVSRGGPQHFLLHHLLRFPKSMGSDASYGNAIHQTLEFIQMHLRKNEHLPTMAEIFAYYKKVISRQHLSQVDHTRLIERGYKTLEAYMAKRHTAFSKEILPERNFSHEGVVVDRVRLTGAVDRLQPDNSNHAATITDFKTGKSFISWQGSTQYDKHKLHKFRQQLQFYTLLIEHSRTYSNYRVTDAKLEFVEPDEDGSINILGYTPNEADLLQFRTLLQVVWKHIITLDFPDISQYSPDFKGTLQFEKDLRSGKT